eukprot:2965700-Lingulodinium_polyedra.AAC.1
MHQEHQAQGKPQHVLEHGAEPGPDDAADQLDIDLSQPLLLQPCSVVLGRVGESRLGGVQDKATLLQCPWAPQ